MSASMAFKLELALRDYIREIGKTAANMDIPRIAIDIGVSFNPNRDEGQPHFTFGEYGSDTRTTGTNLEKVTNEFFRRHTVQQDLHTLAIAPPDTQYLVAQEPVKKDDEIPF